MKPIMANSIINKLRHNMSEAEIPFEARMLGFSMLLVNIPTFVYGLLAFWTMLPIPGLILYGFGIALAFGKQSAKLAKLTTILTMLYHLILLIILISMLFNGMADANAFLYWSYVAATPFSTICFGFLLLRTLKESKTDTHENA